MSGGRRNRPTGLSALSDIRYLRSIIGYPGQVCRVVLAALNPSTFRTQAGLAMKILHASLMAVVFLAVTGCNTVAGAGKDIERGGEKVQDTAKDVQQ